MDLYLEYKEVMRKQKTFLRIVKHKLDLKPEHCSFDFIGLFNGDKTLGNNLNNILNDNWKDVYEEMKPSFEEALGLMLQSILNEFFAKLSLEEAFD